MDSSDGDTEDTRREKVYLDWNEAQNIDNCNQALEIIQVPKYESDSSSDNNIEADKEKICSEWSSAQKLDNCHQGDVAVKREVNNQHDTENKQVPNYESESSSDSDIEVAKKKKLCLNWNLAQKFDNCNQADMAVKKEDTWSLHYYHETEDGKKKYYRCNKLKRRGPQCSARLYLLFESTSDSVYMFRASAQHDHDEKIQCTSSYGLSDTVKTEINKMLQLKMKPKAIMQSLEKMDSIKVPKMSQLRNYLSHQRQAMYSQPTISLGELKAWIHSHNDIPLDPHEVFVICYQIYDHDENNPNFSFAISTKYLVEISKDANVVHVDATYKISWQGFPVLVFGTTDRNQKFHPLVLMVSSNDRKQDFKLIFEELQKTIHKIFETSWNPEVLVCSATKSIQSAFLEVFGDDVMIRMCWAHAKKEIQEKVQEIKSEQPCTDILSDVDTLHCITKKDIFDAASKAFLRKYKDQNDFVAYFREQWLLQNRNWFLGAAPNSPSTNNALESFMKVIKDSNTLRERFPLARFLVVVKEMVNQWSNKYTTFPENNYVAKIPSISIKKWADAYEWAKTPKEVSVKQEDDNYSYYQIPAGQATKCEVHEELWESFDDFKRQNFSKWLVLLPKYKKDWIKGKCDCPDFFATYICKHVIGLAIRLKYVLPPPEAKSVAMGGKRKRSHTSKATRALIIQ